ncbi:MAG: hypothetical protein ACP5XB_03535 [Isosphaeraceae bacterium]
MNSRIEQTYVPLLRHPDGRTTLAPVHAGKTIGPGLMAKILRDREMTRDQLAALL